MLLTVLCRTTRKQALHPFQIEAQFSFSSLVKLSVSTIVCVGIEDPYNNLLCFHRFF